jgi:hypothetical protein
VAALKKAATARSSLSGSNLQVRSWSTRRSHAHRTRSATPCPMKVCHAEPT